MKRLATLVLAASFLFGSLALLGQGASATPFSDVPANHWAYQAIQSLAADGLIEGYPDGKFKGDRPMTRYEMAVLVARVIAKVQASIPTDYATKSDLNALANKAASKADLDKLAKLVDAFKDELDALGVRVTNLEDSLDALDKRTKFAQSIEFHGFMTPNWTMRQRTTIPRTIAGTATIGGSTISTTPYLALDNSFMSTDFTNGPYFAAGGGIQFRYDDKFTFIYHITDNLTISLPVHIYSDQFGGEAGMTSGSGSGVGSSYGNWFGFEPTVNVMIAKAGALSNLEFKIGIQDTLKSSRTGLTYKAPDISQQGPGNTPAMLGYQKGMSITGTLNGLTDFQFSFVRVDPNMLNTQSSLYPNSNNGWNGYLFAVNPEQISYNQTGYPGPGGSAQNTVTFSAGGAPLAQAYLTTPALTGTVYVSAYNGTLYNSSGQIIGGGTIGAPAFVYNASLNAVIFTNPLPAGSTVSVTFLGLTASTNNVPQRYQVNGRINQKIKGIPGAEIGVSMNRVFDYNDQDTTGAFSTVNAASPWGQGLVSDTVFGVDAQLPLGFNLGGPDSQPVVFGELSNSKFTPDYQSVSPLSDWAWVAGVNFKLQQLTGVLQYQSVGSNYMPGVPFRYYGVSPPTFAYWKLPYFPAFYGFANQLGLNSQFDSQFAGTSGAAGVKAATSATLTYDTPIFNPFIAGGPGWFSSFSPNSQGVTGSVNVPFTIGDLSFAGRLAGAYLTEIHPNSVAALQYGPSFSSSVKENFSRLEGAVNFSVPVFKQRLALGASLQWDRLQRADKTLFQYYPFNPNVQGNDPASVTLANSVFPAALGVPAGGTYAGGSQVSWAPNYINVNHWTTNLTAALPLTRQVTFSALYNIQTFGGSYQTLNQNMSQSKIFALGAVTYSIPNTQSSIAFSLRSYRYTDNVLPTFNLYQPREDFSYTIRF